MTVSRRRDDSVLGKISVKRFLRDYWQKRPVLIRQAVQGFSAPVTPQELIDLASRDDVESRVVTAFAGRWKLTSGPFAALPRRRTDWTLLVQGVNLHLPAVDALLQRFAFLPYTRLDDVMVSYALPGGSVGPHFDSYDVFLIQTQGRRRWRISRQDDLELIDGLPLKILKHFAPTEEWILEPGDLLYLPPQIAHEGVALDASITCSVGFRAPAYAELAREFLFSMAETVHLTGRYQDATRSAVKEPALIDGHLLKAIASELGRIRWTSDDIRNFAGRYFSEPKAHVYFDRPRTMTRARFLALASRFGVAVDAKTRLLYQEDHFFINGETICIDSSVGHATGSREWLTRFANLRFASPDECRSGLIEATLAGILHEWFNAGWITKGATKRDTV